MQNYYDPSKAKSFNKLLNFILGGRGIGKSFGYKEDAIKKFIKKKEQFLYIRRTEPELSKINTFFDDIRYKFKNNELKVEGGKKQAKFMIDGICAGIAAPLTGYKTFKSSAYPDITTIIFDEFIPEKGGFNRYLPNEVEIFLNLVDSIVRSRDNVHVYLLANTVSIVNVYFQYFKIEPGKKEFTTFKNDESKEQILIQICHDQYLKGRKEKSQFQKLISGTRYGDYSQDGKFINDSDDFISKPSRDIKYLCTLYLNNIYYAAYMDSYEGKIYINKNVNKEHPAEYSLSRDGKENMMLQKAWRNDPRMKLLIDAFHNGFLYYEDQNIKYEFMNTLTKF